VPTMIAQTWFKPHIELSVAFEGGSSARPNPIPGPSPADPPSGALSREP